MVGLSTMNQAIANEMMMHLLGAMTTGECTDPFQSHAEILSKAGKDLYIAALEHAMGSDNSQIRILACGYVLEHSSAGLRARKALGALQQIVSEGTLEEIVFAAYWLQFTHRTPSELVPALERAMGQCPIGEPWHTMIAAAILQAARPDMGQADSFNKARRSLITCLNSQNPQVMFIAARRLATQQLHLELIRSAFARIYQNAPPELRVQIVSVVGEFGSWTQDDVTFLEGRAGDVTEDKSVRIMAIACLGDISKIWKTVDAALTRLCDDRDWQIVSYSVAAIFRRYRFLPDQTVQRLIPFISSADSNFRGMAAERLEDAGPSVDAAIPALIAQLCQEPDDDVAIRISLTLSHIGEKCLPGLKTALLNGGIWETTRLAPALIGIGAKAPREIAELLHSPNSRIRELAAHVLQFLGPDAIPAVDIVVDLLKSTEPGVIGDALTAVKKMGCSARAASADLSLLLFHESGYIRESAADALVSIGIDSIPALKELQATLPPEKLDRVDSVLQRLGHAQIPTETPKVVGLDGITNRRHLELFAEIGDVLIEFGPLSFKRIESHLAERFAREDRERQLSFGASTLRLAVQSIEGALSREGQPPVKLVGRGEKQKGGLTIEGKLFHTRVKHYLAATRE